MNSNYNVDVGWCVTNNNGNLTRIECRGDDGKNYCCSVTKSSSLIFDSGMRACCSYEDYADEHWVTIGIIKSLFIFSTVIFANLLLCLAYFYLTSRAIKERDVKTSRRVILKELLKEQILHKSDKTGLTAFDSLMTLSNSLSSSVSRRRTRKDVEMKVISDDKRNSSPVSDTNKL